MRDGSQMEELSGAVGLGLLAGDVVLALGRLINGRELNGPDRPTLEHAQSLLESLSGQGDAPSTGSSRLRQFAAGETAFDVLSAIETEAAETELEDFVKPLA